MKNLIICEGPDDMLVVGYYLNSKSGWERQDKNLISESGNNYKVKRGQRIEHYKKEKSSLDILGVGGKDRLLDGIHYFVAINNVQPNNKYDNVVFVLDRDESEICDAIEGLKKILKNNGVDVDHFDVSGNAAENIFEVDGTEYKQNIVAVFVPYSSAGSLEDLLICAIKEKGEEESKIVDYATNFIELIVNDNNIKKYLRKQRLETKARFSAVLSITNPDHSTGIYDDLLSTYSWEEFESINNNFRPLIRYIV